MTKYKNRALERRVGVHFPTENDPNRTTSFYPNEKYLEMIKGFAYESMESVSKIGCRIFKDYFEKLTPQEKDKYLRSAKLYKGKNKDK
jgi:hypothetical protein